MSTRLLTLPIGSHRDVLTARQRARQIADLLGYDAHEQVGVAAAVFEVACSACDRSAKEMLHFDVEDDRLQVSTTSPGARGGRLRFQKGLPPARGNLTLQDLTWVIEQLDQYAPVKLFDEIRRQNQDLLHAYLELRAYQKARNPLHPQEQQAA